VRQASPSRSRSSRRLALLVILGGCALGARERELRLPGMSKESLWNATREVLERRYRILEADPAAGRLETDYLVELVPLYRHRVSASLFQDLSGRGVVRLRVLREKLSEGLGDYGEAFEKGTWVQYEGDGGLADMLLREIGDRLGAR
jgi:hypothetical protein